MTTLTTKTDRQDLRTE